VQKPFIVRTNWSQFHGNNAAHTGFNPFENTINTSNVQYLDLLWSSSIGPSGTSGSPVVANGNIYVIGDDNKLYAFNATTGAPLAAFPKTLGDRNFASPAVGFGNVYAGTVGGDNRLYAFNATSGAAVPPFPIQLSGAVYGSPVIYGANVYVATFDGKIYGFNATTGAGLPNYPIPVGTGEQIDATVSIANGIIYVGNFSGKFFAYDVVSGAPISGFPGVVTNALESTAAISGLYVVFKENDGHIYALRAGPNTIVYWSQLSSVTGNGASSPAIAGNRVFAAAAHEIDAYHRTSGALLWRTDTTFNVRGSPVVANGVVYLNSTDRLDALDAATGAILWSAAPKTGIIGNPSPVIVNGIVYLASADGRLYAFSVHGQPPASRLPGGEQGVRPTLRILKPDTRLKPVRM
jgi:outer membrane protein assembly factor BamB